MISDISIRLRSVEIAHYEEATRICYSVMFSCWIEGRGIWYKIWGMQLYSCLWGVVYKVGDACAYSRVYMYSWPNLYSSNELITKMRHYYVMSKLYQIWERFIIEMFSLLYIYPYMRFIIRCNQTNVPETIVILLWLACYFESLIVNPNDINWNWAKQVNRSAVKGLIPEDFNQSIPICTVFCLLHPNLFLFI